MCEIKFSTSVAPVSVSAETVMVVLFLAKTDKKLNYHKETMRLHDITSSSAVAEKKHSRVKSVLSGWWVMFT